MKRYYVEPDEAGERIDRWLSEKDEELSRSRIQKLLKDGAITVNGKPVKSSYKVEDGDQIEADIPAPVETEIVAEDIPLDILYEDDDVILINKPKGMVVHPAPGHYSGTLVNALMFHCRDNLSGINGELRPGIVHRIDRDTTGVLVICKNDQAHRALADQLKVHSITRKYYAIVSGNLKENEGTVDATISRHPTDRKKMCVGNPNGRNAVTHWRVLERFGKYTDRKSVV